VVLKHFKSMFIPLLLFSKIAANRADCEARGCVWQSSTTPSVPFCFYSRENMHGYSVIQNPTDDPGTKK